MKRLFDVLVVVAVGVLFLVPFCAVALLVRLTSPGPILYWSDRVGRYNKIFRMPKFRSMRVGTPAVATHLLENPNVFLTPIGPFLRKSSLDELPQLWSILLGDMSLVGPRPALPREVAQYDTDAMRRLDVRPGLTGLWQVSGRSNLSWDETVRLDVYYVDNWSIMQDLSILMRTARAVLGSSGAY